MVTRYSPSGNDYEMEDYPDGDYVEYSDYEDLLNEYNDLCNAVTDLYRSIP
jgi:hypothetical protein